MHKNKKILVGLSGGVDSAVSAYLLKEAGYEVSCGFMINYLDEENPNCTTKKDLEEAKKVAKFLDLPLYTFDYRDEYETRIVEYIFREYEKGNTPNPDVFCNNLVKFDLFLEEALSLGYDAIATGHYARIVDGKLYRGLDPKKDQSYFLSRLSDFQISKAIFPIGELEKSKVREIAKKANLPNADRKDSQGLCFIGKVPMKEFLAQKIKDNPGDIIDTNGKILGKHLGVHRYTIGQRKGIEIGGGPALFVVKKDAEKNQITVGIKDELTLFSKDCMISDWKGDTLKENTTYQSKIRHGQTDQNCTITVQNNEKYTVNFENPQRAIAPGQICVIYDGERVLGSGVIEK
ncbi:tRNA 2-thiouridine(34) synthase MnmA [Candidatus Gracilibacteria bacterium]|nr:tRNA 2-thiouridine(34) synthase MnmA [Candidatus Gracilibacteria bacterium]